MTYIKMARMELGLTQKQLGDKLYRTKSCISNYETGYRKPERLIVERIKELLAEKQAKTT